MTDIIQRFYFICSIKVFLGLLKCLMHSVLKFLCLLWRLYRVSYIKESVRRVSYTFVHIFSIVGYWVQYREFVLDLWRWRVFSCKLSARLTLSLVWRPCRVALLSCHACQFVLRVLREIIQEARRFK